MNSADSMQVSALLEQLGYQPVSAAEEADVIVLNTCVVRQSAEDKAIGRLTSLKDYKTRHPNVIINLMGCLVGVKSDPDLKKRFPFVDIFSAPSDPEPLITFLANKESSPQFAKAALLSQNLIREKHYDLPVSKHDQTVSVFVPIVYGCSHACTYCVIPLRRGREQSRPSADIINEIIDLTANGVREVTLLGQIVDRYGQDQAGMPTLGELLRQVHAIDGVQRIRFLTSHPLWMNDELLDVVASLPKIMPHFELPIQSGDDQVLQRMRRGYSVEQFMKIVDKIRQRFTTVSIATDLIVGFPGETEIQFENTLSVLNAFQPDMTHVARYSPRPGTFSTREMEDDVPSDEKMRRFRKVEQTQEAIVTRINQSYLKTTVPVLFEDRSKKRWRGRTPTNKLVFVESEQNLIGKVLNVEIHWTGPWSLIGDVV